MDELCDQIHKKRPPCEMKIKLHAQKDHSIKCTTFTTICLTNHFSFNWKKCILCHNPPVLVMHLPQLWKLMLNIDYAGWWDFIAVVCPQGESWKPWSYDLTGAQVNTPSVSYTSPSSIPPHCPAHPWIPPLTLEWASHPGKPSVSPPATCGQDGSCPFRQRGPASALICLCSLLLIRALGQLSLLLLTECAILATTGFMKSKRERCNLTV